jgi:hypothetical protein
VQQPHWLRLTAFDLRGPTDLRQRPSTTSVPLDGKEKVRAWRGCALYARFEFIKCLVICQTRHNTATTLPRMAASSMVASSRGIGQGIGA